MFQKRWAPATRNTLWAGIAFALLAAIAMQRYESHVAARDPGPLIDLVTAGRAIPAGAILRVEDLSSAVVPERTAPRSGITEVDQAVGAVALGPIGPEEVITTSRVSTGGPIAGVVPSGLRAIVVPSGLPAGIVRAGDLVDVLATHTQGALYTETAADGLQVIQVIPADDGASTGVGAGSEHLALLVDATSAERIAQVSHTAVITIAIRSTEEGLSDAAPDDS